MLEPFGCVSTFLDFHECICVKSSSIPKTAARHFRVVLLSNLYTTRICIREFLRETFHDYVI
jgi:hypothetical protein